MKCAKCGSVLAEGENFCAECGTKVDMPTANTQIKGNNVVFALKCIALLVFNILILILL